MPARFHVVLRWVLIMHIETKTIHCGSPKSLFFVSSLCERVWPSSRFINSRVIAVKPGCAGSVLRTSCCLAAMR